MDQPSTGLAPGQLSADQDHYWDGGAWVSSVSPDGLYRWDGARWLAVQSPAAVHGRGSPPLWSLLLFAGIAALAVAAGVGAYTAQFSSTCTSGGCQDIWLLWIFIGPPGALVGLVLLIVSLVMWRSRRVKRRTNAL